MSGKRQEIIEKTAALMKSRGYENTKINDIMEACQIGKGQFYYYFSSKHELGLAVVDHLFVSFHENMLQKILSSQKQPEERLKEMLEWIVARHAAKEVKCGCVFGNFALEMSEHDPGFRESLNRVFAIWANKIELALLEMLPDTDSSEIASLAQAIVAMIEGGILLMKNNQDIGALQDMSGWIKYLIRSFEIHGARDAFAKA